MELRKVAKAKLERIGDVVVCKRAEGMIGNKNFW